MFTQYQTLGFGGMWHVPQCLNPDPLSDCTITSVHWQPTYMQQHSLLAAVFDSPNVRFPGDQGPSSTLLSAPRLRTTFASRGFSVAAPAIWNSLLSGIRYSSSTHTFCRLLKTHCFQQTFSRLTQVPQIQPLADNVHSKYSFTYLAVAAVHLVSTTQQCTHPLHCAASHK